MWYQLKSLRWVLGVAFAVGMASAQAQTGIFPTHVAAVAQSGHETAEQKQALYQNFNMGLTWYGYNNNYQKQVFTANSAHQPLSNVYFDPSKSRTLIVVHGWLPGSSKKQTRLDFDAEKLQGPPGATDMARLWRKSGWNVGMFYWNQLADEPPKKALDLVNAMIRAETKIWSIHGPEGMRYHAADGHYYDSGLQTSVARVFADQYEHRFKGYHGSIRLVGESLGTQLVIHAAALIDQDIAAGLVSPHLLPTQIVLLDPALSKRRESFLQGRSVMDYAFFEVKQLKRHGVVVSGYRTSLLGHNPFLADNTTLLNETAFSQMKPDMYKRKALINRHRMGIWWYLLSYQLSHVPVAGKPGLSAPFARANVQMLRNAMYSHWRFVQVAGMHSLDVRDTVMRMAWKR
jgi:hypothetical protein